MTEGIIKTPISVAHIIFNKVDCRGGRDEIASHGNLIWQNQLLLVPD
jgi:hypothetical protein